MQSRKQSLDAVDHFNDIRARLALNIHNNGGNSVCPSGEIDVFRPIDDGCHIRQPNRRAIPVGDDNVPVSRRTQQLIIGVDRISPGRPVEIAFRGVDVGIAERGAQIVYVQSVSRERSHIGLHANRWSMAPAEAHETDPGQLRDLLGKPSFRQILHLRQGHRLGGEGDGEDWGVRGIDFGVDRRRRKISWEQISGCIYCCLDFLLRNIEARSRVRTAA